MQFNSVASNLLRLTTCQHCLICEHIISGEGKICRICERGLVPAFIESRCIRCYSPVSSTAEQLGCKICLTFSTPIERMRYLWEYTGIPQALIRCMKYRPSIALSHFGGDILAYMADELFPSSEFDCVIPMPTSSDSLAERLFNQCLYLGKPVAQQLHVPLLRFALRHTPPKHRKVLPQAALGLKQRLINVRNIFQAEKRSVVDKSILLVDDVITTGATAAAAATALLDAGANRVQLLTLARSPNWITFQSQLHQSLR
jgi:ComF family protein